MYVPLSWLRDYLPLELSVNRLSATFDDLGMIVESVQTIGRGLDRFITAKVVEISSIPKADRIRKVIVDTGNELVQVVCGANNFSQGQIVALAQPGIELPNGIKIQERKMKGILSSGMLCSSAEVGLSSDSDGLLILDEDSPVGISLDKALGIDQDVVFDLAIEPNRPDAMSIAGVARDLAARLKVDFSLDGSSSLSGLPYEIISQLPVSNQNINDVLSLRIDSKDLCHKLSANLITGIRVKESPQWLQTRLMLAGMRPINSIVDISNYLMLDLGQPSHAYDFDKLKAKGLLARQALEGEELTILDGTTKKLGTGSFPDCLICDAEGNPLGIGGIMGGKDSEISDSTTSILIEAAYFEPMAIARTSRRLGIRSEASIRFERGCDPEIIQLVLDRFSNFVLQYSADSNTELVQGTATSLGNLKERNQIRLRTKRVNSILGTNLNTADIASYINPIGFETSLISESDLMVKVPTFRPDVEREIDVIEEVGRHFSYSNIFRRVPRPAQVGRLSFAQKQRRYIRQVLAGSAISEVWTSTLLSPGAQESLGFTGKAVEVENPLVVEESILRMTLMPGILQAITYNLRHQNPFVRFFEIGKVFYPPKKDTDQLPQEKEMLAIALANENDDVISAVQVWQTISQAFQLDSFHLEAIGDVPVGLHSGRWAKIVSNGVIYGSVGELDPIVIESFGLSSRVGWIEIDLGLLFAFPVPPKPVKPISRYPSSDLDLAFVVDNSIAPFVVESVFKQAAGDVLESVKLFDVYRDSKIGPNKRSLAFRLRFSALDRTFSDKDLSFYQKKCIQAVETKLGAKLRDK